MTQTSELRTHALRVAAAVRPEQLTGTQAAQAVQDLALTEKAVATTRMFLAVRVAKTDAWRNQGHHSAADWLAAQCGISVWEANKQLGTAKRAEGLPKTKDAMARGELSPDQADAVTDAATADPTSEDELLHTATNDTTKHLREEAARRKAAATDTATRQRRIHAQRTLRRYTDADGAFNLHLRGPATDGIRLEALLRPYEEHTFRTTRTNGTNGTRDTYDNRAYDAFITLVGLQPLGQPKTDASTAGTSVANPAADPPADTTDQPAGTTPTGVKPSSQPADQADQPHPTPAEPEPTAGQPKPGNAAGPVPAETDHPGRHAGPGPVEAARPGGATRTDTPESGHPAAAPSGPPSGPPAPPDAGPPPAPPPAPLPVARPPGGNNIKVIVRIDHTALARGHTIAGETCEVVGIGPIPVGAAKELMRDAFLAAVITKGRDVLNVAHLGRALNAHQRTAIEAMGLRCSNIACNRTIALQIDHRTPWTTEQITELPNQDPLCPECHRRKTHHNHQLEPGHGPRRLLDPTHPDHPDHPDQAATGTQAETATGKAGQTEQDDLRVGRTEPTDPRTGSTPGGGPSRSRRQARVEQPQIC